MDACCNSASNLYHCLFDNAEINIDTIIVAIAELNNRILQLREEITAFKNEHEIDLTVAYQGNLSSLTPSEFNDSMKNVEKRTGAQYELQRNFKGDDLPGSTDLSARLSFTKRALEVKATNEAVVFKEDYPRDDKSIEDDKRPNRSRVSETSGMYRKSISDAEKFGKEISEKSGNVRDIGRVKISCVTDEKLKVPNKYQNKILINDMYCGYDPPNVITSKIKRKRISRGVQYSMIGYQNRVKRFFLSYFGSKSSARKYNLTRKTEREEALMDKKKFYNGNEVNESLDATTTSNESHNVKLNNIVMRKEKFKNNMKKIGKIICGINHKKIFVRLQNIKNKSPHNLNIVDDSENNKNEISESNFENNRMNARKREHDDSRDERRINIFDREIDSNNAVKNSDRESIANKVTERLDSCIVELNGIIGDVYVVFNSKKNS